MDNSIRKELANLRQSGDTSADFTAANVVDGDNNSTEVFEQTGFTTSIRKISCSILELVIKEPSPKLTDRERTIPAGEYGILDGNDQPLLVKSSELLINSDGSSDRDLLPGVNILGQYTNKDGHQYEVISFLYNKLDANGNPETDERVIIMTGVGYGEHPGHPGQPPTWYLVGPQIGTQSHDIDGGIILNQLDIEIPSKNFSVACITGNLLGVAILANPALR